MKLVKRFLDFFVAFILIVIIMPVVVFVGFVVFFSMGKPVLFTQRRPGKNSKIFKIYKFKTMNNKRDEFNKLLPDDERLTSVGRIIRKMSLDELPQLINVLKGEMSFVGPRPLLIEYLDLYTEEQKMRHNVLPGITGWAQVNGRNAISWEKKFELDVWYVENWTLFLDLKIILMTIKKVIQRKDVSADGVSTAKPFMGSNE